MEYEVSFVHHTGMSIDVEADSPEQARELAGDEMSNMALDLMPEVYPDDFTISEVTERIDDTEYRKHPLGECDVRVAPGEVCGLPAYHQWDADNASVLACHQHDAAIRRVAGRQVDSVEVV